MLLHQQGLCSITMVQLTHTRMEWHSSQPQMLPSLHTLSGPQEKLHCMQVNFKSNWCPLVLIPCLLWKPPFLHFWISTAPFGPGQSTPAPAYSQIMYSPYTPQPMPYMTAQQQYQYPMPVSIVLTTNGICVVSSPRIYYFLIILFWKMYLYGCKVVWFIPASWWVNTYG